MHDLMYMTLYIDIVCVCIGLCTYVCSDVFVSSTHDIPILYQNTGNADPSIFTSTSTPCYGHVVTLLCYHPEVASYNIIASHLRISGLLAI